MTGSTDCRLIGRWRIVEADLWGRDYLDLVGPATLVIRNDGHGEIAFGAMEAGLDLECGQSIDEKVCGRAGSNADDDVRRGDLGGEFQRRIGSLSFELVLSQPGRV